jgi:hypothetical protein
MYDKVQLSDKIRNKAQTLSPTLDGTAMTKNPNGFYSSVNSIAIIDIAAN